jgi:GNAT superfamily N-acetyltransferase
MPKIPISSPLRASTKSGSVFTIRQATLKDLDALVSLRRAEQTEFGQTDHPILDKADRVFSRWARSRMKAKRLVAWLAEKRNGTIVGCGCLWLQPVHPNPQRKRTHRPYLLSMYTDPKSRGRGLATRIVLAAMDWCRKHGYHTLSLHASDLGKGVYKSLGFKPTSEMRARLDDPNLPRSHARL